MAIRQARLDDVAAIRDVFIAEIDRWQRIGDNGQVEDLPYHDLSIYERWLHGGAWMTVETGAIWLTHLVAGAGIAVVLTENNTITGYAEAFHSDESDPFGEHLHIGALSGSQSAQRALVNHLIDMANDIGRITVASTIYDKQRLDFYRSFGFSELSQITRVNLAAQGAAVGFYKVTPHQACTAADIEGWQMPIGRVESARYHLEHLMPQLWHAVPEIMERKLHRLRFNAGGQDAYVVVHEHLYNPRSADVYCWTPKALSTHLVGAIRDMTYKTGYRSLSMAVSDKIAKILESDMEQTAHQNVILARNT